MNGSDFQFPPAPLRIANTSLPVGVLSIAAGQTVGISGPISIAGGGGSPIDYVRSSDGTAIYLVKRTWIEMTIAIAGVSGNISVVAPVSGKRIRMLSSRISGAAAVQARWMSNTTQISARATVTATNPVSIEPFTSYGWRDTSVGEALKLDVSTPAVIGAALLIGIDVSYIEI